MPMTYAQNKIHINNYRANHPEKMRAYWRKYDKKRYAWKQIKKIFLNILLD